jgi:outer membrane receptor for ferric coprogen and ferric-rhodotorulic acid
MVYELNPFIVEQSANDVGYITSNSTSGTSINMLTRDLPMPLEVLNQELINDLGATDFKEALDYSAGVFTQSFQTSSSSVQGFGERSPSSVGSVNDPFQNAVSIRGYSVPNQQRMGFRVGGIVPAYGVVLGGTTDSVMTDRLEVVRGPQALLYGTNVLSGIVNIIPKRPLSEFRGSASLSVGNFDYFRSSLDVSGPVIQDKLNYRLLGAYQTKDDEIDFRSDSRQVIGLQFDWKILPKLSLFAEYVNADREATGIGPQYITNTGAFGQWTNEYDEAIQFGRDDPTVPWTDTFGTEWGNPLVENDERDYPDNYEMGRNFNLSGPDTYLKRKENNIMALLTFLPSESLSVELGTYYTTLEDEQFNVDFRSWSDRLGIILTGSPQWAYNPEVGGQAALDADPLNQVVGEVFAFPVSRSTQFGDRYRIVNNPQNPDRPTYTRKFARYTWYRKPTTADTLQIRGRVLYKLDTDFFDIPATHSFIGGYHFIEDRVDFVTNDEGGGVGGNNSKYYYSADRIPFAPGRLDQDPFYLRDSIFDFEPLRYNGEVLAVPGFRSFGNLGGLSSNNSAIVRSGWKESTLWFRGLYGIYSGQFWNDRLTIIAGMRQDSYQVKEKEQLMIVDSERLSDVWVGAEPVVVPRLIGYGDRPYVPQSDLPDALNDKVAASIETLRAEDPNGTADHLFDDTQRFTTGTAGFSFRATDDLSVYFLYSEGIFPNSGQRDGAYNPIDAEQTTNKEIGIKFDLFDRKLSGTLSVYEIERKNAVYNWSGGAPAPANWHGGPRGPINPQAPQTFSPQAATAAGSGYLDNQYRPRYYGVAWTYVKQALSDAGLPIPYKDDAQTQPDKDALAVYGVDTVEREDVFDTVSGGYKENFVYIEYDKLINDPDSAVIKEAFDRAVRRERVEDPVTGEMVLFDGEPIYWGGLPQERQTASEGLGANITFEEVGIGVDGQLIFTPIPNYQMVFSFSHQKREVTGRGFNLVDAVDENGVNWGTEYDKWVWILGPENFEDPTRPSTFTGGSVKGLDLSFVPQTSLRMWHKYSVREGALEGLSVGAGVQYNSSVPTSVPIGGASLSSNRYLTPDVPERFVYDAMVSYGFEAWGTDFSLSFNVDNLLDDNWDEVVVEYEGEYGNTIKRRTQIRYEPRFYRFSLTARF